MTGFILFFVSGLFCVGSFAKTAAPLEGRYGYNCVDLEGNGINLNLSKKYDRIQAKFPKGLIDGLPEQRVTFDHPVEKPAQDGFRRFSAQANGLSLSLYIGQEFGACLETNASCNGMFKINGAFVNALMCAPKWSDQFND